MLELRIGSFVVSCEKPYSTAGQCPRIAQTKRECRVILLAFLICVSFLAGCRGTSRPAQTQRRRDPFPLPQGAKVVSVKGEAGGRIVTATLTDPKTFNPLLGNDQDSLVYKQLMHPGLARLNLITQEPEPELADKWVPSADYLTWTFHLRQGLVWSDGRTFTAADVIFTMKLVNDASIPSGAHDALSLQGKQIEWTQIDDYTLQAKLPSRFAPFLRVLDGATVPILPEHRWESVYSAGHFKEAMQVSMDPRDSVVLGAFRLGEYRPGQRVVLIRNPRYWKKDLQGLRLPYLDELVFLILTNQDQIELKIETGEIDTYPAIRPEDVERVRSKAATLGLTLKDLGPSFDTEGLILNQNGDTNPRTDKPYMDRIKRSWFTDVRFRKAISSAMDRDAIVRTAFFGRGQPTYGPECVNNALWYTDKITSNPYDPTHALQLLHESGFALRKEKDGKDQLYDSKGNPVRFSLNTNAGNNARATECSLIASDLARIGMKVEFTPLDFNALVTRLSDSCDFDAVLLGFSRDNLDPSSRMSIWMSNGRLHAWWPRQTAPHTEWERRINELMTLQLNTYDQPERKKYYDEVQRIVTDQLPIIYTATQRIYVVSRQRLENLKPTVSRHRTLWNAEELSWTSPQPP
jgi:peptide/nickel transport system substrate-binding protein